MHRETRNASFSFTVLSPSSMLKITSCSKIDAGALATTPKFQISGGVKEPLPLKSIPLMKSFGNPIISFIRALSPVHIQPQWWLSPLLKPGNILLMQREVYLIGNDRSLATFCFLKCCIHDQKWSVFINGEWKGPVQ